MKKPALVYSEKYFMDLGGHVFPGEKYRLVYETLKKKKNFDYELLDPFSAPVQMLELVHTVDYLDSFLNLKSDSATQFSELPLNQTIVSAFLFAVGGTILAAREALERGAAGNIGGGFHHAYPGHAEGFCYLNDLAVAVRALQFEKRLRKAAVIDCDLHQGNGTAKIFEGDQSVFTFSIHQENNYPPKEKSCWDIGLPDFTEDEVYLEHLNRAVPQILETFKPEIVLYQAGADPFLEDQLGQLSITKEGLKKRDRLVYEECLRRKIPVAVTLGGGYAQNVQDTVAIHVATIETLLEVFKGQISS